MAASPEKENPRKRADSDLRGGRLQPVAVKLPQVEPLRPKRTAQPFDHAACIFEIKYDGFRCVATKNGEKITFRSKEGKALQGYSEIETALVKLPGVHSAIFDGELVHLVGDKKAGQEILKPDFMKLLLGKKPTYYYLFDLLHLNGEDLRERPLIERKEMLRKLIPLPPSFLLYANFIREKGIGLFNFVREHNLEGVVAKVADAPYRLVEGQPHWFKILNPDRPVDPRAALINKRRSRKSS